MGPTSTAKRAATSKKARKSERKLLVFTTLLLVLTLTSILLLAMDRGPLTPDAARSLYSVDAPNSLNVICETEVPFQPDRWKSIYIHQSAAPAGNATNVSQAADGFAEHFLIGNGDGCVDGELQLGQRWNKQQPATPTWATPRPDCIMITVVGDFANTSPTPTQLLRLKALVQTLQNNCHIPADQVFVDPHADGIVGCGSHFPVAAFREQLSQ